MMLFNPTQAAVYRSVMEGNNVIWMAGRQEGKTYVGARCLEALDGMMFEPDTKMATHVAHDYPDVRVKCIKTMHRDMLGLHPPLLVFDEANYYDYQDLMDTLKANSRQFLFLAVQRPLKSMNADNFDMVIPILVARGYRLFST